MGARVVDEDVQVSFMPASIPGCEAGDALGIAQIKRADRDAVLAGAHTAQVFLQESLRQFRVAHTRWQPRGPPSSQGSLRSRSRWIEERLR